MAPTVILLSLLTFIVILVGGVTTSPSHQKSATTASYNLNYTQTSSATGSGRARVKYRTTRTYRNISPTKVSRFSKTVNPTEATTRALKPTEGSTKPFKPSPKRTTVKPFESTKGTSKPLKPSVKWTEASTKALKPTTVKPTLPATKTTSTPVRFNTEDLNENIDKNVERRVWNTKESEEPPVFGK